LKLLVRLLLHGCRTFVVGGRSRGRTWIKHFGSGRGYVHVETVLRGYVSVAVVREKVMGLGMSIVIIVYPCCVGRS
jgi:hypothetical protein